MRIPAFVINLDRATDRRAHIFRETERAGLSVVRISAVDGTDVPDHLRPQFFAGSATAPFGRLMPGEIGCYASHLLAYESILEQGLDWALILEDDVSLAAGLPDMLLRAVARLPDGWDIVRLSSEPSRSVLSLAELRPGRHLVRYSKLPKQAGGQLVSAAGARKLLGPHRRVRPIDADLRHGYLFDLESYGIYPPPVHHSGLFRSSIKPGPGSRRNLRGARWETPRLPQRLLAGKQALRTLGLRGIAACLARDAATRLLPDRGGQDRWSAGRAAPDMLVQSRV